MDISLLLPREKYAEVEKRLGRGPSVFEIENEYQSLFYFGANHSRDPANHQYPVLREYWDKFLKVTEGKEKIVLVEGTRQLFKTEEQAIIHGSEGNLITMFAHAANIPIASPDISDEELMKLLPYNQKEEVLLYLFLSFADNWRRYANPKPDFEKHAISWLERQKGRHVYDNIDVSLDNMKQLYKEIIGRDFSENDNLNNLVNPNNTGTRINEIARDQSDLRDLNIASEIERYWNEGKSVFVVFGRGHLIIQELALKKLLK